MPKSSELLELAKQLRNSVPQRHEPPYEPNPPHSQQVLAHSLFQNTRGYLERTVYQINGSYENGWFDACAVMIRRLMETLIIEVFEHYQIAAKIKNPTGDYLYLRDLIDNTLKEASWNLGRNTKSALPKLKDVGDQSAHNRRFTAHKSDIDKVIPLLRTAAQELLYLAGLK